MTRFWSDQGRSSRTGSAGPAVEKVRDCWLTEEGRLWKSYKMKTRIYNGKLKGFTSNFRERKKKISIISSRTTSLSASSTSGSTSESSSFQNQSEATTPRSKVDAEIRDSGVSLSVIPKPIRNKLLIANALSEEIKVARKNTNDQEQQA